VRSDAAQKERILCSHLVDHPMLFLSDEVEEVLRHFLALVRILKNGWRKLWEAQFFPHPSNLVGDGYSMASLVEKFDRLLMVGANVTPS